MSDGGPVRGDPRWAARGRQRNRVWSLFPAACGAIAYVVLYLLVQPWLNESSDLAFFLSLGLLTVVLAFTVFALVRAIWGRRSERPRMRSPAAGESPPKADERNGEPPEGDSNIVH